MARRPDTESEESSQNIDERQEDSNGRDEVEQDDEHDVEEQLQYLDDEKDDEQDELDGDDNDEDDEEGPGTPKGKKRARVNEEGESVEIKDEPRRPVHRTILKRDTDGYVPGSIVRVKLHQFLTYDDVEFKPGPYLNMVLGPNGTGKSSIACALCLGLNWPPSVLGRATKVGNFVKLGKADGFIELEVKGPIGEPNLVIQRSLTTKMTAQQTFTLNGVSTPGKEISARVQGLGIQVNNLCSFLPQDKVAEFARMTPQGLLRATQEAAGDEQLIAWHDFLIQAGKDLKDMTSVCAIERREVETLEQRNGNLEKEVTVYRNRRAIEKEVELLEVILPAKEYLDARSEYKMLKEKREELHQKAMTLKEKSRPVMEFKEKMIKERDAAEKERERCRAATKAKFESLRPLWDKGEDIKSKADKITDELTALKNQEKKRKIAIRDLKEHIHKLEHDIAHPPEIEDLEKIADDFRKNEQALNDAELAKLALENKITPYLNESEGQKVQMRNSEKHLENLENVSHRKLERLRAWDRGCAEVVEWLRGNQGRFKMGVIEPAALSVDVKNGKFASAVEAAFNAQQMKTFVFLCEEDRVLFNHLIVDTGEGMGRKYRLATWFRPERPDGRIPPPMNEEELRQQGFDAYGIDCVTFPEGMRRYLEEEIRLHRFAIAQNPARVDVRRAMEAVSKDLPNGQPGGGNFVAGGVLSQVSRSRYGERKPFNNTRDIPEARSFKSPPIDQEKKRQLENTIAQAKVLIAEAEATIANITNEIAEIGTRINEINSEKTAIDKRRKAVHDVQRRMHAMRIKLEDKQQALKREENAPSIDEKRAQLRLKGVEFAKQRLKIAQRIRDIVKASIEDAHKGALDGLRFLQLGANVDALEKLIEVNNTDYTIALQAYNAINEEFEETKRRTKRLLKISQDKLSKVDDETKETFLERQGSGDILHMKVDEVRDDIANLRAQLELISTANEGVIEQYEARKADIERKTKILQTREKHKSSIERKVQKIRGKWLPALKELIENIGEKFSAAFDRVNCAGEIRIAEHPDDYSAWAIDILVKFRDSENLQLLTGQRQSGGERALTTIMYLMSLTELAHAPFSLVDEINQGMDAFYERSVHNALVEVTCSPDSGQYFLITPKLLTDLKYHERMKVLCVSNGEWLPDEQEERSGNMMGMIDTFLAHHSRRRAS